MRLGNMASFLYPFCIDRINAFPTHSQSLLLPQAAWARKWQLLKIILHSPCPLEASLLVSIKQRSHRFPTEQKTGIGTRSSSTSSWPYNPGHRGMTWRGFVKNRNIQLISEILISWVWGGSWAFMFFKVSQKILMQSLWRVTAWPEDLFSWQIFP